MATDTKKFLDLEGLSYFKSKQDAYNATVYIPLTQKAAASGVATLDSSGKVPSAQLPSYVDDVVMYADYDHFPGNTQGAPGEEPETGKIYVAEDDGKCYRWAPPVDPDDPESHGRYINVSSASSTAQWRSV